jgi:WD40 repeat protein
MGNRISRWVSSSLFSFSFSHSEAIIFIPNHPYSIYSSLFVWNVSKKKPVFVVANAHPDPLTGKPCWITSVCCVRHSDLVISGSSNGEIKLWKLNEKSFVQISSTKIVSISNAESRERNFISSSLLSSKNSKVL